MHRMLINKALMFLRRESLLSSFSHLCLFVFPLIAASLPWQPTNETSCNLFLKSMINIFLFSSPPPLVNALPLPLLVPCSLPHLSLRTNPSPFSFVLKLLWNSCSSNPISPSFTDLSPGSLLIYPVCSLFPFFFFLWLYLVYCFVGFNVIACTFSF